MFLKRRASFPLGKEKPFPKEKHENAFTRKVEEEPLLICPITHIFKVNRNGNLMIP